MDRDDPKKPVAKRKRKNRLLQGAREALSIARGELEVVEAPIMLSARDWRVFKHAISYPPKPNARLKRLMRRKPPWQE